ncbi:uncharacterized protein LOC115214149 [Octopus sinensis]|uniref:Uncharacterized protein LOC115214149 n=1 Tax=Octopus sinensis TaxID=2607531 RepID=A0A6P7SMC4_9MOLL|nr:uncharacterized protein LOC115214149 [Octopus sinensis]
MRRKTCIVWNYFTAVSAQDAFCKICGRNVRYHRSNTNLRSHLRVWHRKIWCEMSDEMKNQSSRYNSVSNEDDDGDFQQMDNFNPDSMTPYTSLPTVVDDLNINNVSSTEFRNLSQEEEDHEQRQQLSPHPHSSIQPKPTLGKTPLQSADVTKDIYILPNSSISVSNSLITENINLLNSSDRTSIHQFHQKPGEELGETDRTQDSGVISIDDCDMIESKDIIAAQIELLHPSQFAVNNENCHTRNGDNEKNIHANLLPDLEISNTISHSSSNSIKTNSITKSTDGEIDSIAEYFKICDNSTRQTFLDVMRNDRDQHALALDSMSSELKSVSSLLQEVRQKQQRKKDRLEELLSEVSQVQADYTLLEQRNTELTQQEAQLQDKLKQYSKKVSLCDSALNAMTNGKELQMSVK